MFSSISALILLIALYGLLKIFGNYLVKHPLDTLPGPPPSSILFGAPYIATLTGHPLANIVPI